MEPYFLIKKVAKSFPVNLVLALLFLPLRTYPYEHGANFGAIWLRASRAKNGALKVILQTKQSWKASNIREFVNLQRFQGWKVTIQKV
jgi:hypothetical protein